jgi:high-affinity iron transporter
MGGKKKIPSIVLFLPLVLGSVVVLLPRQGRTGGGASNADWTAPAPASGLTGSELVFLLQYVGSDYAGAVENGAVISDFEYQEMLEFTRILTEEYEKRSPGSAVVSGLGELRASVLAKEDPRKVLAQSRELVSKVTKELGLVTYPVRAPVVGNGETLYRVACAQCHGENGDGRGLSAFGQDPPPTSFREARMKSVAPHQLYNAIGFGVDGTSMPSFDAAYDVSARWDIAFYLMTLRDDFAAAAPRSTVSITVRDLATMSDEELRSSREVSGPELDYFRSVVPETSEDELIRLAQAKLEESYGHFQGGDRDRAVRASLEAYLEGVEPTEATLLALDSRLVKDLERELALYRTSLRDGAPTDAIAARLDRLRSLTDDARETLLRSGSGFEFAFVQSGAIILREGIEAALLVALLLSYLAAAGHPELRRHILGGAIFGLVAGVVTWAGVQYLVSASTLEREALEGITSLLAAAVLFSVSFWIIHNADLKRWKGYIEERAKTALGTGSGLALATVSFFAVYREAFETVLFYQALWLRSGERAPGGVLLGFAAGTLLLVAVVLAMFRYGKRIPLKPFFVVTGILLGMLALVFAGYGIAELQKIGWIQETALEWVPYVPFLDLQPTTEGLSLQLGIFLSFVLSWFLAGDTRGPKVTTRSGGELARGIARG